MLVLLLGRRACFGAKRCGRYDTQVGADIGCSPSSFGARSRLAAAAGRATVPAAPRRADRRLLGPDRRAQPGRRLHRAAVDRPRRLARDRRLLPSRSWLASSGWHPQLAMAAAGALGGLCGLALGLPSLRLPGFYFAMATMAFALIVGGIVARAGRPDRRRRRPARAGVPGAVRHARTASTSWSPRSRRCHVAHLERRPPHVGPRPDRRSATARSRRKRSACRCSAPSSWCSSSAASPPGIAGALFAACKATSRRTPSSSSSACSSSSASSSAGAAASSARSSAPSC